MHTVAVVAQPGTIAFDLATPVEVFGQVRMASGGAGYQVVVCGTDASVSAGALRIATDHGLEALASADTIVVPGRYDVTDPTPPAVLVALRDAFERGVRIASICTGAFTLAAAGLLAGRRATTHWRAADAFRAMFPAVHLDPDVLYVDEGQVVTGAGAMAGVDMCLHLLRREHGSAIANTIARDLVAPPHRHGGQAQYLAFPAVPATDDRLADVLAWATAHLDTALDVDTLADRAMCSRRSFYRWFKTTTGTTPHAWLRTQRLNRAEELLETTDLTIDNIAHRVGYASATALREQFTLRRGVSPHAYRRTFRGSCQEASHADGSMPHA